MKLKSLNQKAQILGMPFQMIFSIILIAAFLYVAVIGIKAFLDNASALKAANFVTDFKTDMEKAIVATESSKTTNYQLPSSVTSLCFTNDAAKMSNTTECLGLNKNPVLNVIQPGTYVFFCPLSNQKFLKNPVAKVDCATPCLNITVTGKNPYCIPVKDGVASITLIKGLGKPYVTIN
jgi:hypothetical protein